jgi:hypothetical protein
MQGLQAPFRKDRFMTSEQGTVRLPDGEEIVRVDRAPLDGPSAPLDPREAALQLRHLWRTDPRAPRDV